MNEQKPHRVGIVWFRQDLRLADNPALAHALVMCDQVVPLFVDDPANEFVCHLGGASRAWLKESLKSLSASLVERGGLLYEASGDSLSILEAAIADFGASAVYWNRCYDPVSRHRDGQIKQSLRQSIEVRSFNGLLFCEPWELSKGDGTPYRVFTPFWNRLQQQLPECRPVAAPRSLPVPAAPNVHWRQAARGGVVRPPTVRWDEPMLQHWHIGETQATLRIRRFVRQNVDDYGENRNRPDREGTSRASPALHFGEISVRQCFYWAKSQCTDAQHPGSGVEAFLRELGWREFAWHLLYHFPQTVDTPLDRRFDKFPWPRLSRRKLQAWQRGGTGVPIVDAGMRQLWNTGWMHNRVRMIVASYLVKNLGIHWHHGERWFRDTLVDADLASNVMGWQWVAGSGADAAPYFRVFNPVLQGEKFDPAGDYVRHWVPELASLPASVVHKPWTLPKGDRPAGYPQPLVDLKASREAALHSFAMIR